MTLSELCISNVSAHLGCALTRHRASTFQTVCGRSSTVYYDDMLRHTSLQVLWVSGHYKMHKTIQKQGLQKRNNLSTRYLLKNEQGNRSFFVFPIDDQHTKTELHLKSHYGLIPFVTRILTSHLQKLLFRCNPIPTKRIQQIRSLISYPHGLSTPK
jgi:hypothetical protein